MSKRFQGTSDTKRAMLTWRPTSFQLSGRMVKYRTSKEWRYERVNLKDTDNCVESEWRLSYMCEGISTSEKASTDQAVQVQERKQG